MSQGTGVSGGQYTIWPLEKKERNWMLGEAGEHYSFSKLFPLLFDTWDMA
jgi:hypothetical protein